MNCSLQQGKRLHVDFNMYAQKNIKIQYVHTSLWPNDSHPVTVQIIPTGFFPSPSYPDKWKHNLIDGHILLNSNQKRTLQWAALRLLLWSAVWQEVCKPRQPRRRRRVMKACQMCIPLVKRQVWSAFNCLPLYPPRNAINTRGIFW